MIPYNTQQDKLALPEYGRLVHDMIKICGSIEDRDQRNAFAATIVETMKAMTQEKGKFPDDRKYWDHLFLISGSTLDIDSPFGRPAEADMHPTPNKIPYTSSDFGRRHYGNVLQRMVRSVAAMPNSTEKDIYVEILANHIKKLLVINNDEGANDRQVFSDLSAISGGSINVEEGVFELNDYQEEKQSKNQKRKKNR